MNLLHLFWEQPPAKSPTCKCDVNVKGCSTCGPWSRRCQGEAARAGRGRKSCRVWVSGLPWVSHGGGGTQGCYRGASQGWRASFLQAASAHRHWNNDRGHHIKFWFVWKKIYIQVFTVCHNTFHYIRGTSQEHLFEFVCQNYLRIQFG